MLTGCLRYEVLSESRALCDEARVSAAPATRLGQAGVSVLPNRNRLTMRWVYQIFGALI